MTPEMWKIILKASRVMAPKYRFGYYDAEDMIQEAILICVEAVPRYDGTRPFENFIRKHLSNRLKNFRRDNYNRKKIVIDTIPIQNTKDIHEKNMSYEVDYEAVLSDKDIIEQIMDELPAYMREDFLRLLEYYENPGSKIDTRKPRFVKVLREVRRCLKLDE